MQWLYTVKRLPIPRNVETTALTLHNRVVAGRLRTPKIGPIQYVEHRDFNSLL